jgi:hypothetical protein
MRWLHPVRPLVLAALVFAAACGKDALAPANMGISVLFIGNAYSGINDLPGVVEALLDSAGPRPNHTEGEILIGLALKDHWVLGTGKDFIDKGGWSYVIMQQGPSVGSGFPSLVQYAKLFAQEIRAAGAKPGLWEVWPIPEALNNFDGISASYQAAADSIGGLFVPAADTWQRAWTLDPSLKFYADDGASASPLGTYALAITIAARLAHKDPDVFPDAVNTRSGETIVVDARSATLIKYAARSVLATR